MKKLLALIVIASVLTVLVSCGSAAVYDNVREYVEDNADSFTKTVESFKESGIELKISSEGDNVLIYEAKYPSHVSDESAALFRKSVEGMDKTPYVEMAKTISEAVAVDDVSVVVRYLNDDGSVICEMKVNKDTDPTAVTEESFDSLEDYVESDEIKAAVKAYADKLKDVAECEVTSEGDTLVYTIKYLEQIDESRLSEYRESIEKAAASQEKDTFDAIIMMKKIIRNIEDPSVAYRYLNADGTLITEIKY